MRILLLLVVLLFNSPTQSQSFFRALNSQPVPTSYSAEATALFLQMSSQPDVTRKAAIDAFIVGCKADVSLNGSTSNWTEIDYMAMLAAHTSQAGLLNWKSPSFTAITSVSTVYTLDRGFAGNGSSAYLNTNWNATTNGVKYVAGNSSYGIYLRTEVSESKAAFGVGEAATNLILYPRLVGGSNKYVYNEDLQRTVAATTAAGFHHGSKNGTGVTYGKNGSTEGTLTGLNLGRFSLNCYILAYNSTGSATDFSTNQVAFFCLGSKEVDYSKLNTRLNTFKAVLGF